MIGTGDPLSDFSAPHIPPTPLNRYSSAGEKSLAPAELVHPVKELGEPRDS